MQVIVTCSCGKGQRYDKTKATYGLISIFRHFHEPHGTIDVRELDDEAAEQFVQEWMEQRAADAEHR